MRSALFAPVATAFAALLACGSTGEVSPLEGRAEVPAGGAGGQGAGGEAGAGGACTDGAPDVDSVHYVVTQDGEMVIEGDIPIDDPAATVSVLVGGLPPGEHEVNFYAGATVGCGAACTGYAPFAIETKVATNVGVQLLCRGEDDDGVILSGGPEPLCALDVIRYYTAVPALQALRGAITLTSDAEDVRGQRPEFHWSANGGSLAEPDQPETTFFCPVVAGTYVVTLTVSAAAEDVPCSQSVSFEVECAAFCGNGVLDAGETCDPEDPATAQGCPTDCTRPVCGDGVVEGTETCEPPATDGCDDYCHASETSVCGNGLVESGEECEPPGVAGCDQLCHESG